MTTGKTFKLTKPIKGHGDKGAVDIGEITLRGPIADDVFELEPIQKQNIIDGGKHIEFKSDGRALRAWLTRLSGLDAGVLGGVLARDIQPMRAWLQEELSAAKN